MVALVEKIDGVVLSARWTNVSSLLDKAGASDEALACARAFLGAIEGAVRSKEGEIKFSSPEQVLVVFPAAGRVGDTEMRAVECSRRILMEFRRYNAKQPLVPMNVTIALTTGPLITAPGIAEVGLTSLVLGEPVSTADRMLRVGRPDTVVLSDLAYSRVSFVYKGRALDGQTPKVFELIL